MRGDVLPSVSATTGQCPLLTPTPTAPCPTLTPLTDTNGMISYDPVTNMATYGCVSGYTPTITSGDRQRTCQGTSGDTSAGTWTGTPATVTCAREYCILVF